LGYAVLASKGERHLIPKNVDDLLAEVDSPRFAGR
jgi:hypothetical protein